MTEYITKEQAIGVVEEAIGNIINSDSESVNLTDLEIEIQMTITDYTDAADVVEVVRCKDCKNLYPDDTGKLHWCDCHRMFVGLDDFCNYGKRKEGADSV